MKKYAYLLVVSVIFLIGCDNNTAQQQTSKQQKTEQMQTEVTSTPRIALVMKTLTNPFFIAMENGARRAEQELGVSLVVKTATQETSISQQIEIVDKLLRDKEVDAIVIAPGDSVQLIPVLKKARDAGIVVVNIDNQLDKNFSEKAGLRNVPFISVDNVQGAYLSAKYIADQAHVPMQAAILEGIRSADNAQDRKTGAQKAFGENSNIQLVASETANWKIDEGLQVTREIFNSYPEVKLLFCANDMMALGAIQYLKESGRSDVLVAGYDALDEAKEAVRAGQMEVTIDQQPQVQGYMGVQAALDLLNGKPVMDEVTVDVFVISKETL